MSSEGFDLFRLVIAAVNGVLFAFGIVLLLEMRVRRPRRWKKELRTLIARAEQLDLAGDEEANTVRAQIDELKDRLNRHYNNPRSLLAIGFAILMIALALMAMISLITPPFEPFAG